MEAGLTLARLHESWTTCLLPRAQGAPSAVCVSRVAQLHEATRAGCKNACPPATSTVGDPARPHGAREQESQRPVRKPVRTSPMFNSDRRRARVNHYGDGVVAGGSL